MARAMLEGPQRAGGGGLPHPEAAAALDALHRYADATFTRRRHHPGGALAQNSCQKQRLKTGGSQTSSSTLPAITWSLGLKASTMMGGRGQTSSEKGRPTTQVRRSNRAGPPHLTWFYNNLTHLPRELFWSLQ